MRRAMLRSFAGLLVLSAACANAAAPQAPATPAFDGARAFEHLRKIVEIGPRPAGSPAGQQTRAYILKELAALGITAEEQPFEARTPAGVVKMANVRASLPASGAPGAGASGPGRIIVAGHYDTKIFDDFTFVGANDGGSSTAFLLELARVLKARQNAVPIELLFLDGEEAVVEWALDRDGTYGSRHYVEAERRAGTVKNIRALVLVDMIADRELVLKREQNSTPWLTDIIWSAAKRLQRPEFVDASTPIEDDHIPFLRARVPAVDLIDLDYPDASMRYWHTAEDTLDKVAASSLQAVGDVLLAALPAIELRVK
jgi:Zn-dependent M28 family amino/carboxypeptidase